MILAVAVGVFVDMGVVEPDFLFFDPGEGVTDLAPAGAQRFDLGAAQDNPRFKSFEDMKIPPRLRVGQDIGHNEAEFVPGTANPNNALFLPKREVV